MQPISEKEAKSITNSFQKVFQTGDISKLTRKAYNFIMLSVGFIAHYNLEGFRGYYSDVEHLKRDILKYQNLNQRENFRGCDSNYEYYSQKAKIYKMICNLAITTKAKVNPEPEYLNPDELVELSELVKKESYRFHSFVYSKNPYCCGLEECLSHYRGLYVHPSKIKHIERTENETKIFIGRHVLTLFCA